MCSATSFELSRACYPHFDLLLQLDHRGCCGPSIPRPMPTVVDPRQAKRLVTIFLTSGTTRSRDSAGLHLAIAGTGCQVLEETRDSTFNARDVPGPIPNAGFLAQRRPEL
jgi:hypothetical protein